jgi:hypothetical protein
MYTVSQTTNITAGCSSLYYSTTLSNVTATPTVLNLIIQDVTNNIIYDSINLLSYPSCGITTNSTVIGNVYFYEFLIPIGCLSISGVPLTQTTYEDALYCLQLSSTAHYIDDGSTAGSSIDTLKYLNLCTVCCQTKQLGASLIISNCLDCDDKSNRNLCKFIEANTLLTALEYAGTCASYIDISKSLCNLQEFLSNINCKECH